MAIPLDPWQKCIWRIVQLATSDLPAEQVLPAVLKFRSVDRQWNRAISIGTFEGVHSVAFDFGCLHSSTSETLHLRGRVCLPQGPEPINFHFKASGSDREGLCMMATRLFGTVDSLSFDYPVQWPENDLQFVHYLVKHFDSLRRLCLTIKGNFYLEEQQMLWELINRQVELRELILNVPKRYSLPRYLPAFNRLEYLSISGYKGNIIGILWQVGPSIRRISLDCPCKLDDVIFSLSINPFLSLCVADLAIYGNQLNALPLLQLVCRRFPKLQRLCYFSVCAEEIRLTSILPSIQSLAFLVDLNLKLTPAQLYRAQKNRPNQLPVLANITNLELEVNFIRDEMHFYAQNKVAQFSSTLAFMLFCMRPLYDVFPNVKRVRLEMTSDMAESHYEAVIEETFLQNFNHVEACSVYLIDASEV